MKTSGLIDKARADLRFSFRTLMQRPVFAATCALTLALGIGTTTAVFSVLDATLLRPLPYREPGQLRALNVLMSSKWDGELASLYGPSQIELVRWRAARSFEAIEGLEPRVMALSGTGEPAAVDGAAMSQGLFGMLGLIPLRGRIFTAEEEMHDTPLAVVSERFVRRHLSGADSPIGKTIVLDGVSYEICGVMSDSIHPLNDPSEVWIPMHPVIDPARSGNRVMSAVGRLRRGISGEQAQQELTAISADIAREFPTSNSKARPLLLDLKQQTFGSQKSALLILAGAAVMLLLLACVNLMNLIVGHLAMRGPELAIRSAIGADTAELVRLQVIETLLLAVIGGSLGIGLMRVGVGSLLALYSRHNMLPVEIRIDWRVALFGILLMGLVATVCGVAPAIRAHRSASLGGLTRLSGAKVGGGSQASRARALLVAMQVALAVTLLCGSGIFLASLQRLVATNPGYSSERVWSAQLRLSPVRYADARARARFVKEMLRRIEAIPGVIASGTTQTTFQPNESMQTLIWVEGRTVDPQHTEIVHIRHVTPGYFPALRIRASEGRAIDQQDDSGTPMVCMVNARFEQQYWPSESAVGHRIRRASAGAPWLTIIGVTGNVMDNGLGVEAGPTIYLPYLQQNNASTRVTLLVRTADDANRYPREIEQAVWSLDPEQPLDNLDTLSGVLHASSGEQRFRTVLISMFAAIGLILAGIGVYGVTSASVTSGTREMGVRLALGATSSRIVFAVVQESARSVLLGTVAGLAMFLMLGRLAESLLYGVYYADPFILLAAIAPLVATAFLIAYLQARRLAGLDAWSAIRSPA